MDFSKTLTKANAQLDRVKIAKHNNRLRLVATLPRKDGQPGNKQQKIATGYPANANGVKLALSKAQILQGEIYFDKFSWSNWGEEQIGGTCGDAIAKMTSDWEKDAHTPEQRANFERDYLYPCQFLRSDYRLTEEYLRKVIERESEAKTRLRKRFAIAFQRLAKTGGLDCDLSGMAHGYKPQNRIIPTETEILAAYEKISNEQWRWAFGMIATFGLRPHEIFKLDCSRLCDPPHLLSVLGKTKTGERSILPLSGKNDPAEKWVADWQLWDVKTPSRVDLERENKAIGGTVSRAFKREGVAFPPYSLRHAYAIRCSVAGLSPNLAAKAMGHSLSQHFNSYHRWLNEADLVRGWIQ
ncbi:MAG: site-specific integrase [Cyanobacteria bacterium SBLK]|nr:site-specific integrase [Cyanobacteria bacterium SBLK]